MAGVKISALPAGTNSNNADLVVVVQGGVTKHLTVAHLLTGNGTDAHFGFFVGTGSISVGNLGGPEITAPAGIPTIFAANGIDNYVEDGSGNLALEDTHGVVVGLTSGVARLTFDSFGGVTLQCVSGSPVLVSYHPGDSSNWSGDPIWVNDAIDRIANVVAALLGSPIP